MSSFWPPWWSLMIVNDVVTFRLVAPRRKSKNKKTVPGIFGAYLPSGPPTTLITILHVQFYLHWETENFYENKLRFWELKFHMSYPAILTKDRTRTNIMYHFFDLCNRRKLLLKFSHNWMANRYHFGVRSMLFSQGTIWNARERNECCSSWKANKCYLKSE